MASNSKWGIGQSTPKLPINHIRLDDEKQLNDIFEFGELLGQGSFGKVYLAIHKNKKEKWAIKSVSKEKAGSAAVKLLEREVNIMKKVNHQHIIHLEEVYETSKKMCLVMELCDRGGLDKLLEEKVSFNEKESLHVMSQLAKALAYLHANDIVHRDLKLDNILLCQPFNTEDFINIKITDFGLSYVRGGIGSDYMMQQVCGTPMYMAPEVITNLGYSDLCDIWSCGVILYTLISGLLPFRASTEEELHELIQKGHLDFSQSLWQSISRGAKALIERMLKVNTAYRCTSKELLNDPWIQGETNADRTMNVIELMKEEHKRIELMKEESQKACQCTDAARTSISPELQSQSQSQNSLQLDGNDNTPRKAGSSKKLTDGSKHTTSRDRSRNFERRGQTPTKISSPPSYMQPTKSSSAAKNPNTKDKKGVKL